jgi:hypothetical protein
MPRHIHLDEHDEAIANLVRAVIDQAMAQSHQPSAVAKRIVVRAMAHRNQGRRAAIKKHPFAGCCEASGLPIERHDADLDELDPTLGYAGGVRWVCKKANNSGRHSCGKC